MNNRRFERVPTVIGWLGDQQTMRQYLIEKRWLSPWLPMKLLNSIIRSVGVVAFANNLLTGLIMLTALGMHDLNILFAALLAGLLGVITSKCLGADDILVCDGVTLLNGILTGCISTAVVPGLLGVEVDLYFWLTLSAALVITCIVDQGLNDLMSPTSLPALSMAFNVVVAVAFLAARGGMVGFHFQENNLPAVVNETQNSTIDWIKVAEGSILSAGQVYGVGTMTSSILIWVALFVYSPILASGCYVGSGIGSLCGLLFGSLPEVYVGLWSYNSLLTAGGLSYFLEPSVSFVFMIPMGAFMTVITQSALTPLFLPTQVPMMSYPFNIVTILILAISTQDKRCIKFVTERSFPEYHAVRSWQMKKSDVESGEVAMNLQCNY